MCLHVWMYLSFVRQGRNQVADGQLLWTVRFDTHDYAESVYSA
jgi:hypothetical protein